jgi:hypothetical protein
MEPLNKGKEAKEGKINCCGVNFVPSSTFIY